MKKILAILLGCGLLFLTACSTNNSPTTSSDSSTTTSTSSAEPTIVKTTTPTIFFHGYSGTANSFNGMISRMEADGYGTKELVLTVSVDGNITAEGEYTNSEDNPIVQVLFEDNKNNEWNQAEWVKTVLVYLQENYQVEIVNIVGHSMGGVSSFRYLTAYGYATSLPTVAKFVAIGSPFNDFTDTSQSIDEVLANGPTEQAQRYLDFAAGISNVSSSIQFLLLAGQLSETDLSDGTVSVTSALAIYHLLEANGNSVTYQIFPGFEHSQLHDEVEVDQVIENYLWN